MGRLYWNLYIEGKTSRNDPQHFEVLRREKYRMFIKYVIIMISCYAPNWKLQMYSENSTIKEADLFSKNK